MNGLRRTLRALAGVRLTEFGSQLLAALTCAVAAVAGMLALATLVPPPT